MNNIFSFRTSKFQRKKQPNKPFCFVYKNEKKMKKKNERNEIKNKKFKKMKKNTK